MEEKNEKWAKLAGGKEKKDLFLSCLAFYYWETFSQRCLSEGQLTPRENSQSANLVGI